MGAMYLERRHVMLAARTTNLWRLVMWIAICLGGGLLLGFAFRPDAWFATLDRPSFAPPNWVFGPVWSVLYVLMAVAIWRVERHHRLRDVRPARKAFIGQLALNFAWTPIFFGLHAIHMALGIIVTLWAAIIGTFIAFHRIDRPAAYLLLPYLAWVTFATALNGAYSFLN
jgi:benzodiazapine receptor